MAFRSMKKKMEEHKCMNFPVNTYRNLGAAIVIQMLKDYFHVPTKGEIKMGHIQYYNKEVIKKQLASDHITSLTDGLSLTVLRKLNEDEETVKKHLDNLKDD